MTVLFFFALALVIAVALALFIKLLRSTGDA
jgi:hypothetical protein